MEVIEYNMCRCQISTRIEHRARLQTEMLMLHRLLSCCSNILPKRIVNIYLWKTTKVAQRIKRLQVKVSVVVQCSSEACFLKFGDKISKVIFCKPRG